MSGRRRSSSRCAVAWSWTIVTLKHAGTGVVRSRRWRSPDHRVRPCPALACYRSRVLFTSLMFAAARAVVPPRSIVALLTLYLQVATRYRVDRRYTLITSRFRGTSVRFTFVPLVAVRSGFSGRAPGPPPPTFPIRFTIPHMIPHNHNVFRLTRRRHLGPQRMMWERGTVPLEFRRTCSTETQPDPNMH